MEGGLFVDSREHPRHESHAFLGLLSSAWGVKTYMNLPHESIGLGGNKYPLTSYFRVPGVPGF